MGISFQGHCYVVFFLLSSVYFMAGRFLVTCVFEGVFFYRGLLFVCLGRVLCTQWACSWPVGFHILPWAFSWSFSWAFYLPGLDYQL
jgi:hypothetical protein